VRSPNAHANIRAIDISRAAQADIDFTADRFIVAGTNRGATSKEAARAVCGKGRGSARLAYPAVYFTALTM